MTSIPIVTNDASPAVTAVSVTASDTSDLSPAPCRSLYVGTGGNVSLKDASGNTVLFTNVGSGAILPVRASRVMATNTTASDIVALY